MVTMKSIHNTPRPKITPKKPGLAADLSAISPATALGLLAAAAISVAAAGLRSLRTSGAWLYALAATVRLHCSGDQLDMFAGGDA